MRIAILGCRGIPAIIGGFETFAEEVAPRLVEKGFDVTVYCESILYQKPRMREYKGVRLVYIPALKSKFIEAFLYDFLCLTHFLLNKKHELLYMLGDTTAVLLILPKIFGQKIVVNTDGIEWWRSKWPWYGKEFLKFNEWIATRLTKNLIVDSREMGNYYKNRYDIDTTYITNGTFLLQSERKEIVEKFGLSPLNYFTVFCRLEPENSIHTIIRAFRKISGDAKLVIAGGANYKSKYVRYLRELAKDDDRIIFLGVVTDREFKIELRTNCLAYIHGHQVGGTNPSLVEAMGMGNIILANKNPFNMEVAGETAIYWNNHEDELREKMNYVIENYHAIKFLGEQAKKRASAFYNWDKIANLHAQYFSGLLKNDSFPLAHSSL